MNGLPCLLQKMNTNSNKPIEEQTDDDIIQNYRKTCRFIRKGCNFDI